MKLLSIAIPSYNSQDYLRHCVDSLLPGGSEVEILIVDDGSTDATAEIADDYAAQYPEIVRAIHQENGGHGAAVMAGIENATGKYFKVVDSDDWVDAAAYARILETLRGFCAQETPVDMLVSNFVYDKVGVKHKKRMRYTNALPQNATLTWDDVGHLHKGQYLLMHSVIYRTQVLRESNLDLPRHTFYVDNLFVYIPLPHVKTLYYLDVDFYHYFIGREDQSVQEGVMIRRIEQQLTVNRLMMTRINLRKVEQKRLRAYMLGYLEIITMVSSILLIRAGTPEALQKKADFWSEIHRTDAWLYRRLRHRVMGRIVNMPGRVGRDTAITIYKISQKVVGFN